MRGRGQLQRSARTQTFSVDLAALGTSLEICGTDANDEFRAERVLRRESLALDRAASRFRADSELGYIHARPGVAHHLSPLLNEVVGVVLDAARRTGGLIDPTVGGDLARLAYDETFTAVLGRDQSTFPPIGEAPRRRSTFCEVEHDPVAGTLLLPPDVVFDCGAIGKAWLADRIARLLGAGRGSFCVNLGGDVAFGGTRHDWPLVVETVSPIAGPVQVIELGRGALATSSTEVRAWGRGRNRRHHIIDPRTRLPAAGVWSSVTVAAKDAVTANLASVAAVVLGNSAPDWLRDLGVDARLVRPTGTSTVVGRWPSPREDAAVTDVVPPRVRATPGRLRPIGA